MGTITRRQLMSAGALALGSLGLRPSSAPAADEDGISHSAESIHQEALFTASRQRVYEALTDARQFDRVVTLGGVMKALDLQKQPSVISPHAGGPFSLFGGYIHGRQVLLVRNQLLVQAWRADSWPADFYSIARFELRDHESGSKLIFDHGGFPKGEAQSLASGWQSHYWQPIQKLLETGP